MKSRLLQSSLFQWLIAGLACFGLLAVIAAMNGGTALAASDFDPIVTYLKTKWLQSTFIILCGVVLIIAAIWNLVHGKGMAGLGLILVVVVLGVVGYNVLTDMATATANPSTFSIITQ